jgi:hypothetical protein
MAVRLTYPPGGGARVPVSRIRAACGINTVLPGKFPSAMARRSTVPGCGVAARVLESCCGAENEVNQLRVTALNTQLWRPTPDCDTTWSTSSCSGASLVASQRAARCINALPRSRLCSTKACPYYPSSDKLSYSKCQTYDQAAQAKTACSLVSTAAALSHEPPCDSLCDVCRNNVVVRRNTVYSTNQAVEGSVVTAETSRRAQDAGSAGIVPPSTCGECPPACRPVTRAAWRSGCGPSGCLPTNQAVLVCEGSYNPAVQRTLGAKPN